jgi:hypothetical protein
MKVCVNLKVKANASENTKLDLVLGEADTVAVLKERVTALQLIPEGEHVVKLGDDILGDTQILSQCGVTEGTSLGFEVNASEKNFVKQLADLLQARDLSADELGLLYCYKHGVSINQALKLIGFDGKFVEFLKFQKAFAVDQNRVTLVREDTALKPFSVTDEVVQLLKSNSGSMEVKDLSSKFVQKFNVSMQSITNLKPLEFCAKYKHLFTVTGRVVSLKGVNVEQVPAQTAKVADKAAAASMPPPGLDMPTQSEDIPAPIENQQYLDLHNRICGRSFNSKVAQTLNDIVETVTGLSFLNVERVVKGGSVAKGSAVTGVSDAEIVFFLNGLPTTGHDRWLPPLLRATAGVLTEQLTTDQGVDGVNVTDDSVNMKVKGIITVDVRFSPVFDSFAKVIQSIGSQGPEVRRFYLPSLVQERTQFIAKQPGHVKVTIRLLKWWRDQQSWSNKLVRPSDDTLELLAVYSAVQTRPTDQRIAVANVMLLLSQFNDLQIVWSNYYSKEDVWAPLLRQRPLLMDPTNPFINIADPQLFDAREMMSLAKTTRFFW